MNRAADKPADDDFDSPIPPPHRPLRNQTRSMKHAPIAALFACSLPALFTACSSPVESVAPREKYDPKDYVTTFPEPAKLAPAYPWQTGYRPPEDVEAERALRPPISGISDANTARAIAAMRERDDGMRRRREEDQRRRDEEDRLRRAEELARQDAARRAEDRKKSG